jgi:outer membrane lipoprotein-sorting protein
MCKVTLALLLLASRGYAATITSTEAQALLQRSDLARNGWESYSVRVKITTFEAGKPNEEHLYQVSQKGMEKSHVEFLSPREKGQFLLMLRDDMWIYLPDTRRPIRITPQERLTGDASNGDVARTNFAADYDAAYLRDEPAAGVDCHVLELTAKRKGATYRRIEYWIRARDARPVKADFYVMSGKQIKSATFDEYVTVQGKTLLRKMTISDQVRRTSHSVLEFSGFAPREFPDKLFSRDRLDRF